nr:AraC family transcriptional regulator [Paenibacillus phyllosphaerae]
MELIVTRYTLPQAEQSPESPEASILSAIQYVDEHFAQEISVQKLAELANMRPAQFTALFRQITGRKPLEYVNYVRIEQAKELLMRSDDPLRDIASQVGFRDEYYFSRRFRQLTGLAPRQYDRSLQRHTLVQDWAGHEVNIPGKPERILFFGKSAGDLLALGIPVLDGASYSALPPLDLEWALQKQPDLILFDSNNEQLYQRLSRIAPTLTYNSHAKLEERMRKAGSWFGMETEAEEWLTAYDRRSEEMWNNLRGAMQPGETASVLVHHRGTRLFVMGNIGLAPFLYHSHGFRPVSKVREALQAGRAYKEISTESVSQYTGDRIFVMMPECEAARAATKKMFESEEWKALPAVVNGHVYKLEEQLWNIGDAVSCLRLQQLLLQLLEGERSRVNVPSAAAEG